MIFGAVVQTSILHTALACPLSNRGERRRILNPALQSSGKKESGGLDFIRNLFGPAWKDSSTQTSHVSFILGQNIFTPEDITNPNLIVNDRPYAGWLYVGIGLIKRHNSGRIAVFDTLELDLGIVGPESFAEDIQTGGIKMFPTRLGRPAGTISLKTSQEFWSIWNANGGWN